ncbi:MAG: helix-hairpin-helix domain-containing protein [Elusimicrobiota bacterium]
MCKVKTIRYILYFVLIFYATSIGHATQENAIPFLVDNFSEVDNLDETGIFVIEQVQNLEGENIKKQLIFNPVDLNSADVCSLLDIPYMTAQLATKILKYRKKQSFFDVEDIKNVQGVTSEFYEQIKPYITVKKLKTKNVLSGDIKLRCKATRPVSSTPDNYYNNDDSSKSDYYGHYHEPFYFYANTCIKYNDKREFGFLAYRRDQEPPFTFDNIRQYNLKKFYLKTNDTFYFTKIILGNYAMQLNQGLAFYDNLDEIGRPIKIKGNGGKEDKSTNPNQHLCGAFFEKKYDAFDTVIFVSEKFLDAPLNEDGSANAYFLLWREYDGGGYIRTAEQRIANKTLKEKLYGTYIKYFLSFISNTNISVLAYTANYTPEIRPLNPETGTYTFRGNKISLYDFAFDTYYKNLNFFGEWARSDAPKYEGRSQSGQSYLIEMVYKIAPIIMWNGYYNYGQNYYNRFGKSKVATISTSMETDYGLSEVRSQKGFFAGTEYTKKAHSAHLSGSIFNMPAYKPLSISSQSTRPIGSFNGVDFYLEYKYKIYSNFELLFREWDIYSKVRALPQGGSFEEDSNDFPKVLRKTRLQIKWDASKNIRYMARYEHRRKKIEQINEITTGEMIFSDVKYKITPDLNINVRMIFFDAPDEYVTQSEPYWKNVFVAWTTSIMGNPSKGTRCYIQFDQKLSKDASIWFKYEHTISDADGYGNVEYGKRENTFKLQYDSKW